VGGKGARLLKGGVDLFPLVVKQGKGERKACLAIVDVQGRCGLVRWKLGKENGGVSEGGGEKHTPTSVRRVRKEGGGGGGGKMREILVDARGPGRKAVSPRKDGAEKR